MPLFCYIILCADLSIKLPQLWVFTGGMTCVVHELSQNIEIEIRLNSWFPFYSKRVSTVQCHDMDARSVWLLAAGQLVA